MVALIPDTMWACVLHGREDVRLERVPVPPVQDGALLLEVVSALTCGTDLKVFLRGYHARMIVPPAVFGHEFTGKVVVSRSPRFAAGDTVVAANSAPCGACYFCAQGRPNLCEDLLFVNGAYAQYLCLPARIVEKNCHRVPRGLSPVGAALVEPLACAVKGVEDVGVQAGEKVLVVGAGPLGLMLARVCVLAGAEVTCVDASEERLAVARTLGAARVVPELFTAETAARLLRGGTPLGRGFDCVFEAVGRSDTWDLAVEMVRPAGRVNLFGGCPENTVLRVDAARLHYREITIAASFHHTPETVLRALALLASGAVPPFALIREARSLFDLPAVLGELKAGKAAPKTAILPSLAAGEVLRGAALRRRPGRTRRAAARAQGVPAVTSPQGRTP